MAITKTLWGNHNGQEVYLLTIANGNIKLTVTNLGCAVVSIMQPGQQGGFDNMILGYDSLQSYLDDTFYMGCIVGRFANRISNATFKTGQAEYRLAANETATGNHLHGGTIGFHKKIFSIEKSASKTDQRCIQFYYMSPDGEEGYPGNLKVYITYILTDKNEVIIDYKASTDKTTPVNLTSHCYFNLSGSTTPATDHNLIINAGKVLAVDHNYIPTGGIVPVKETNLDFTMARPISNKNENFAGYNDCFQLNHPGRETEVSAVLVHPGSGRKMIVKTTLPGIMLYTGDYLDAPFTKNQGICLEAQFFPDSPNQPHFPSTLLHPGEVYRHKTIYQFKNSR